jgi:hypothetical protein
MAVKDLFHKDIGSPARCGERWTVDDDGTRKGKSRLPPNLMRAGNVAVLPLIENKVAHLIRRKPSNVFLWVKAECGVD